MAPEIVRKLIGGIWQTVEADASSGGTQPHTREQLGGAPVTIADGDVGNLTLTNTFGPDTLLDISTPAAPAIIASGIYALMIVVSPSGLTAGGQYQVTVDLDLNGEDAQLTVTSPPPGGIATPQVLVTPTWYLVAGAVIQVSVQNEDGVASRNFTMSCNVQRVG